MENNLEKLYNQWCKETKRNGSVLVGKSIREFFKWLEQPERVEISKLAVNTKYRSQTNPSVIAVYMVDIPNFVKKLEENYILIKK